MITVTEKEPGMLAIDIDGEIDEVTMAVGLDEMVRLSKDMQHGKLFYTIRNFQFPSLMALAVEIKKIPSLFTLVSRLDRAAVLTNEHWIGSAAEWEGFFIPGLEIKAFTLDQEDEALQWLRQSHTEA